MKKQFLISLISISSLLTINAQIYDTGDKVGIGTDIPSEKLTINGGNLDISNGQDATIYSSMHNLIFSGRPGAYAHKVYSFRPSWGVYGDTWSYLRLQTANTNGEYFTKIQLNTNGDSYFNGGNLGIGTESPTEKLTITGGNLDISNGQDATIYSSMHNLIFSGRPGAYAHKVYSFRPAWGASGNTWSYLRLQTANTSGEYFTKIQLNTNGDSYFNGGNLGIGTDSPAYRLDVCGTIRAKEIKVDLLGGCDFVFKSNYKLMDLNELDEYVKTNQHLPEIAPEKEMIENGVNMKELQMKLLQKIEELTLYTIVQSKKITELEKQNKAITELKQMLKLQNERIEKLETSSR